MPAKINFKKTALYLSMSHIVHRHHSNKRLWMSIFLTLLAQQGMAQVLENLLLLARLDPSNPADLPKTAVDLANVTHEALQALAPFMQRKNIEAALDVSPSPVFANSELVFTCLRNLIDNAIRYAQDRGKLRIYAGETEHHALWRIEDNGSELTNEVLARLGERFYRALGTQTQGTGLGLSICRKIIELHQGKIAFSKSALGGLCVQISLPKLQ